MTSNVNITNEDAKPPAIPRGEGETILVIEDEERQRDFLCAMLVEHGYKAMPAPDGTDAVLRFSVYRNEIDLVMLDMGLPGLSGEEVLSMMLALRRDVKVIAVSRLIRPEVREAAMQMGALDHMAKPYLAEDVLQKIRETLRSEVHAVL